ncbi:MAG: type II toxin-antitoxin system RelE/ParE family toxin [Deferribacteraceae bacterium]|jgi:mRNA-degrading endonuclease RelE of RelBE toxin-antitoxin system|nr:type II toxin-antitoxin system RelE/ParE family toxin [Deferribacteraceae bacterium]
MIVELSRVAAKFLKRLNQPDLGHIIAALDGLENEPPMGDIAHLSGQVGHFRLRVGKYRILFVYKDERIYVTYIDLRGQVYKKGGKK